MKGSVLEREEVRDWWFDRREMRRRKESHIGFSVKDFGVHVDRLRGKISSWLLVYFIDFIDWCNKKIHFQHIFQG